MGSPSISAQKLLAASKGNPDLFEVLQQVHAGAAQTVAILGTTPTAAPTPGQPSPAAPVPAQARGSVSILGAAYIVQLVNPGAQSPISQLQAAQAAGKATALTPLQPVTSIYHQIRASTSPAFNVNSNTKTFGGNTGSTQVYWTITGLGAGTWYFQFRSSFDGINFNSWRNANGGSAFGGLINQVTEENAGNANWALFSAPGKMVMGIGEGYCADGEVFDLAEQLYSSGMFAIAGPNGYNQVGNSAYGVTLCDVDIATSPLPVVGTPDLPVVIKMEYGQAHAAPNYWPGNATVFAICVDPTNENVRFFSQGSSYWCELRLPGGARIAIGQGKNFDEDSIPVPADLAWFDWARTMSICSFTDATDTGLTPHGYFVNQINSGVLAAQYKDGSTAWSTKANWVVIAWETGTDVQTVDGFPWLTINLQGGHAVVIGAGQQAAIGDNVTLPTGYNFTDFLSICTPAGFQEAFHHFQGIQQCSFIGPMPYCQYLDDSFNTWGGICNWLVACWK